MTGWLFAIAVGFFCATDEPHAKPPRQEVYILGQDLIQLLEKDPDAVILMGDEARRYLQAARARESSHAVSAQQCSIRGELQENLAHLVLELVARADTAAPSPLALGLGEAILLAGTSDGHPARLSRDDKGWIAWVEGQGEHTVSLDVLVPLVGSRDLPGLACTLPETPITSLSLKTARAVSDVKLVPAVPLTVRPPADAQPQIEAALGPRGKLDLRWHWGDPSRPSAPLTRARSEVTAQLEPGVIRITNQLRLQVLPGSAQQSWELRASPEERVLDLRSPDVSDIQFESHVEAGEQRILVHFPAPVTAGAELSISSEIPWSGESLTLRGLTVLGALSHRSVVAIRSTSDLDVAAVELSNGRIIDSAQLPVTLRSPRSDLAVTAYAQPFEIKLSALPRRALTTVRTVAVVSIDEDKATVFERWKFAVRGGKISQVVFVMPPYFELSDFLLPEGVQVRSDKTADARLARVFLKGTPDEFELRLRAMVPLVVAPNLAKLDLPWPQDVRSEMSRLYLAGSKRIALEPTPDLKATDEPLDPTLAAELTQPPQAVRSFQASAMLERVALRISKLTPSIRYRTTAHVKIDLDEIHVTQSFEYSVRGGTLSQLHLSIPETIRSSVNLDSAPGQSESISPEGILTLRLDSGLPDPPRLQLSYSIPWAAPPSASSQSVAVPLIRARDGFCEATELTAAAPWTMDLQVQDNQWRPVASTSKLATARPPDIRLRLSQPREADTVTLSIASRQAVAQPETVVDRALIETVVGVDGDWHTRSRYLISSSLTGRLRVRAPRRGRIIQMRCGDTPLVGRTAGDSTSDVIADVAARLPALLEIESQGMTPSGLALWDSYAWDAPELVGSASWGQVLWQISLPDRLAVLRGPGDYRDLNRWRWLGARLRSEPQLDARSLERWLAAPVPAGTLSQPEPRYLYSRLVSMHPISLTVVNRSLLVLVSAGLIMLLGFVLIAAPIRGKPWLILFVLASVSALSVLEPTAAIECAQPAGMGALLVVLGGASQSWLARRQSRKRTVFPEPAVLAKSQGSSVQPQPNMRQASA